MSASSSSYSTTRRLPAKHRQHALVANTHEGPVIEVNILEPIESPHRNELYFVTCGHEGVGMLGKVERPPRRPARSPEADLSIVASPLGTTDLRSEAAKGASSSPIDLVCGKREFHMDCVLILRHSVWRGLGRAALSAQTGGRQLPPSERRADSVGACQTWCGADRRQTDNATNAPPANALQPAGRQPANVMIHHVIMSSPSRPLRPKECQQQRSRQLLYNAASICQTQTQMHPHNFIL